MSEFSESFHLYTDHQQDGVTLLQRAQCEGFVLCPSHNWVTIVPNEWGNEEVFASCNQGLLLHYRYAEDHGWSFTLYHGQVSVCHYECVWESALSILDERCDLDLFTRLLGISHLRYTLFAILHPANMSAIENAYPDNPAYLFAEALGIAHYQWLSPEYTDRIYECDSAAQHMSQQPGQKSFFSLLQSILVPHLRKDGFRGSLPTFRRIASPVIYVLSIRKARQGDGCMLESGIHLDFLPPASGITPSLKKIQTDDCVFWERIPSSSRSGVWAYSREDAENIEQVYLERIRPIFQKFHTFPGEYVNVSPKDIRNGDFSNIPTSSMTGEVAASIYKKIHQYLGQNKLAEEFSRVQSEYERRGRIEGMLHAEKAFDVDSIMRFAERDNSLLGVLLNGLLSCDKLYRKHCFQTLLRLSMHNPLRLSSAWEFLLELLESPNIQHRSEAVQLLAYVAPVDQGKKFEGIFQTYFDLLDGESVMVARHVAQNAGKIAKAIPPIRTRITERLFAMENSPLDRERKDYIKADIIQSFEEYFEEAEEQEKIWVFVTQLVDCRNPKTQKRAKLFIQKYQHNFPQT